jgi:hypothetical protein
MDLSREARLVAGLTLLAVPTIMYVKAALRLLSRPDELRR